MTTADPVTLAARTVGDDWTVTATTTNLVEVADWTNPVVEVRTGRGPDYPLVDTSQTGGSIDITGTNFATGTFTAKVPRAITRTIDASRTPVVYLELSVEAASLGGRRTVGTFRIPVLPQVAVETTP
jgi:hypothetical protein